MLSLAGSSTQVSNPRTPPGPRGAWLLGSFREFRADMLRFFERCQADFGDVVAFRLGTRKLVLVSDPAAVEEVLVTKNHDYQKHFGVRLLQPMLGNGLLLSEGESWLKQRRLMQPAFVKRMTEAFTRVVARQTDRLAIDWLANPQ